MAPTVTLGECEIVCDELVDHVHEQTISTSLTPTLAWLPTRLRGMFDLVVLAVVALAAFAGFKRGFIAPLFAVSLSLVGLYAVYAGPAAGSVPTGTAGIGLGVVLVGVASTLLMRVGG